MGGRSITSWNYAGISEKNPDIDGIPTNDGADRRFIAMPAYLGGKFHVADVNGTAQTEITPMGIPRSNLMFALNDVETGAPLAYMSAGLLSSRTGAMPGLATKLWQERFKSSYDVGCRTDCEKLVSVPL